MRTEAAISREGRAYPELESVDIEAPRAGEIRVRMVATGICHTDVRCHSAGPMPIPRPIVLGHEGAGIVEELGPEVHDLQVGDHVVLSGSSCGQCPSCQRNRPSYCRDAMRRSFGGSRPDGSSPLSQNGAPVHAHFFGQSSFARHAIAEARSAVKMPDDVPWSVLAPLGCGVITGAGAVLEALQVRPGHSLVVFGAGGVGLSAVMAARLAGASHIIAVDPVQPRLQLARELGATHTLAPHEDLNAQLRAILPYGADFSFNTTSVPAIFTHAIECLSTQGEAAFVTAPAGAWQPPMLQLLASGRRLRGILGGDAAPRLLLPMLVEYWRQGRLPIERLVTEYPFEQIATAWADVQSGATVKPVLIF